MEDGAVHYMHVLTLRLFRVSCMHHTAAGKGILSGDQEVHNVGLVVRLEWRRAVQPAVEGPTEGVCMLSKCHMTAHTWQVILQSMAEI